MNHNDPAQGCPDLQHADPNSAAPWGEQTRAARALYQISAYTVPRTLVRAALQIKIACARCNSALGYLAAERAALIETAALNLMALCDEDTLAYRDVFGLDAFQGGAGTSINMNINEALIAEALRSEPQAAELDLYDEVNLHQSTNDVMPTALRVMLLDQLEALEPLIGQLQQVAQELEQRFASTTVMAHTQLQDAIAMSGGRIFATWAGVLHRDRWRVFKARERLKEVNLGGTAIGTGAGAPRRYVLQVIRYLQALTHHPVSRADDPVEATSNYDAIAEAMSVVNVFAQTLRRIGSDIRLLASGPVAGMGILKVPNLLKGSSIMPGKTNPVIAEAAMQVAERVMANDALIARLCSQSELELNAFFPLIAFTSHESLQLLTGLCPVLEGYIGKLEINEAKATTQLEASQAGSLALTPLLGYKTVETLIKKARDAGRSLRKEIEAHTLFDTTDLDQLFSLQAIQGMGYNEDLYTQLRQKYKNGIEALKQKLAQA